jgi:hypothetical protein
MEGAQKDVMHLERFLQHHAGERSHGLEAHLLSMLAAGSSSQITLGQLALRPVTSLSPLKSPSGLLHLLAQHGATFGRPCPSLTVITQTYLFCGTIRADCYASGALLLSELDIEASHDFVGGGCLVGRVDHVCYALAQWSAHRAWGCAVWWKRLGSAGRPAFGFLED